MVTAFKKRVAVARDPRDFAAIDVLVGQPPKSFAVTVSSSETDKGVRIEGAPLGKAAMLGLKDGTQHIGVSKWNGVLQGTDLWSLPERLFGGEK